MFTFISSSCVIGDFICSTYDLMYPLMDMQTHPGGLVFTKFGGNQTTLLDLAFPVVKLSTRASWF
jgi:hypothetical protein